MSALLLAHAAAVLAVVALGRRLGKASYLLAALPLAATATWAALEARGVVGGTAVTQSIDWAPTLGLSLDLRLDPLSLVMVALVSGVGAAVFAYCPSYFGTDATNPRTAATLVAFSGAMLGLVLADDLLALYLFWELTSVTSYLLIGHSDTEKESRGAAQQALLTTVMGGLAMLVGFVLLGEAAGTYTISEILADPPRGGTVTAALVLVLIGAFTKSAQVPFHPWLPAAMAAPTPVSAYLHAASMVKAGVYLVFRLSPGFSEVPVWKPLVISVGLLTMLVGGYRALRQDDLKRLLAFGTVSQLGFLTVLAGAGTREAALAATAVLLAHGLFKSCLFLTVGVIDHETGTRDLHRLSGLGRAMPWVAGAATLAAASMAGVPPLVGFIAKEAAYEAFVHGGTGEHLTLAGLFVGSVLTVAYSARFVWGAFGTKEETRDPVDVAAVHAPSAVFTAVPVTLGALGLLLGLVPFLLDPLVQEVAALLPGEEPDHLALWHGPTPTLALGLLTLAAGAGLHLARRSVARVQDVTAVLVPDVVDANQAYSRTLRGTDRLAYSVTGLVQSGSLPVYLGVIMLTLLVLPGVALLTGTSLPSSNRIEVWSTPVQGVVGLAAVVAAVLAARARRRFSAVIFLGAVGYAVAVLFVLQGAPDLALTQFLVETLSLVVFVLVLRRLPTTFDRQAWRPGRFLRAGVAGGVGLMVAGFTLVATGARQAGPVSEAYLRDAEELAGGKNVVNVILVDFRGFDTLGEITVLVVAAMGVAALVLAGRPQEESSGAPEVDEGAAVDTAGGDEAVGTGPTPLTDQEV